MLLKVNRLNTCYSRAHILHDIEFEVAAGEVVALLGRNGAGKSTTLKSLMGSSVHRRGPFFLEKSLEGKRPFEIARLGLAYVPEDRRIFTQLTVEENLRIGFRSGGAPLSEHFQRVFSLFPNLASMRRRYGGEMSGGSSRCSLWRVH